MPRKLVIVESPAKARTIAGYLGDSYTVEASVGHIRDLPQPSELPADMKKGPFGKFAVDVDHGFEPYYVVDPDKKKKVADLRRALKDADELYLATDEDREGEAIAWHLLAELKPKVPVKRMVFHEITREAIQRALTSTRELDDRLVDVDGELAERALLHVGRQLGRLGEVADVADRGLDVVVGAEVAGDRARLGGRLHDDELACHEVSWLPLVGGRRTARCPGDSTTPRQARRPAGARQSPGIRFAEAAWPSGARPSIASVVRSSPSWSSRAVMVVAGATDGAMTSSGTVLSCEPSSSSQVTKIAVSPRW